MRRWAIAAFAIVLLLGGGYVALWLWAGHELERGFAQWRADSESQGWRVGASAPQRGTWPLEAGLTVPDVSLSGGEADIPGGLEWHAERLVIAVNLLHPRQVVVEARGRQRLRLSILPDIPFTAERFQAVLPLRPGTRPDRLDLHASNLRAWQSSAGVRGLSVATLLVHVRWAPDAGRDDPALAIGMRAADVVLPDVAIWPLGPRMASVSGDATLNGPVPDAPGLAERAAGWRDRGGKLHAAHVTLTWGSLNLSGNATIGLDRELQPIGSGSARVVDPSETLEALAAHGAITRRAAFAANAVLVLMEHVPEGGGSPVVEMPFTLQDRTLSVGSIPLAKLPALVWPSEP